MEKEVKDYYYFLIKTCTYTNFDKDSVQAIERKYSILDAGKKINFPFEYDTISAGNFITDYRKYDLNYIKGRDPGFELNLRLLNDIERTTDDLIKYFFCLFYFRINLAKFESHQYHEFTEGYPLHKLTINLQKEIKILSVNIDEIILHIIYNTINR